VIESSEDLEEFHLDHTTAIRPFPIDGLSDSLRALSFNYIRLITRSSSDRVPTFFIQVKRCVAHQ
jgi:hypothetical protein